MKINFNYCVITLPAIMKVTPSQSFKYLSLSIKLYLQQIFFKLFTLYFYLNDESSKIVKRSNKINYSSSQFQSASLLGHGDKVDVAEFSDCIIRVGDIEIKCHKVVLTSRSAVFCDIFNIALDKPGTNVIEMKNFSVEVVRKTN
uniref:BTB domain-containing protein n=1 Tax=Strongyloides papillosus TaxID=174720 RepID=A0A0N5BA32_STREA